MMKSMYQGKVLSLHSNSTILLKIIVIIYYLRMNGSIRRNQTLWMEKMYACILFKSHGGAVKKQNVQLNNSNDGMIVQHHTTYSNMIPLMVGV